MRKNILLTEAQFKDYMRFQKTALNEIDWKTSRRAYYHADDSLWGDIAEKAQDLYDELNEEINNNLGYYNQDSRRNYGENSQVVKWLPVIQKFIDFANRKYNQVGNLEKLNYDNFKKQHNGMSEREYSDIIDKKYEEYRKAHEDDDDVWTDKDFTDTLSDDEKEYFDIQ